ncbi:alkaline phosphatase family protein [Acidaminobacter hydrogenoformans]|uniref:2,3-bisphosphoglycerate-independent phosphoglycerate mutase n=1 Tax=Acidaminobacter hydrogenoformans DSM 2784 TaxID=1120920 RepID=A0A1G5RSG5_9FIRM|nr:alkaline phosphatase family protein [Acidaminobacter hydrogenoformans]SCZ76219.1 2,3-bisphosphoglycerate-independent phosphoglycerate mutase [Acidaminobacter hydrogenoformans DSM 2784]
MIKTMLFLLDGVGDRGQPSLGGLTPLQAAHCPNLDRIAKAGETGLMVPFKPGIPLGTDQAHYLLFGYEPEEYPGRAVIDAIGENLSLAAEDIILRTSWATVAHESGRLEEKTIGSFVIRERFTPGIGIKEAQTLARALPKEFGGVRAEWYFSHDSHGFLILRNCIQRFDPQVSDTDPFYEGQRVMACTPFETTGEKAQALAKWINQYLLETYRRLSEHPLNKERQAAGALPGNFLLTKWAGRLGLPEAFHLRNGMRGAVVGSSKLLKGVAASLQMDYYECGDYEEAIKLGHQLDYDYIHIHTKAPDTAAHTKRPQEKVRVLEALDRAFASLKVNEGYLYIITGDHSTASSGTLIHSGESVPVVFLGDMTRRDLGDAFDEAACGQGTHRITAGDLMPIVLNLTDRAKLYHLRAGGKRRLYRAMHVAPLTDE